MFYILLCFYLWIYGTLNKISNIFLQSINSRKVYQKYYNYLLHIKYLPIILTMVLYVFRCGSEKRIRHALLRLSKATLIQEHTGL